jgi:pentatricopeptide repeat protein
MNEAIELFQKLCAMSGKFDSILLNVMINELFKVGRSREAKDLFSEISTYGLVPGITYCTMIEKTCRRRVSGGGRQFSTNQPPNPPIHFPSHPIHNNLVSAMPGDDDKTKDTSPEPTLAELAKIMRETCSAVKDLSARVQALEVAAQATTVAMPAGFSYGLPGYGGIPLTSAPSTTTPQATTAWPPSPTV